MADIEEHGAKGKGQRVGSRDKEEESEIGKT
jgi:hypothetical protein